jgi:hypothetical protein
MTALLLAVAALSGCGGEQPAETTQAAPPVVSVPETPPAPEPVEPATAEEPVPAAEPIVAEAVAAVEEPEAESGVLDDATLLELLSGTTWMVGDMRVHFKDGQYVLVEGGEVAEIAPEGMNAAYKLENGTITVTAMGRTTTATWDGEQLVVEGVPARRLGESAENG